MDTPFDELNDSLAHRITTGLARLGGAMRSHDWAQASPGNLTPTQGQIMALLRARAPQNMRLKAIAEQLSVRPATASRAVSTLVRKGLVSKQPSPDDQRAVALTLTARGRATADAVAGWPDFLLRAVDGLSETEQATLLTALIKVIRNLQLAGEIPVNRLCVTCHYFRPYAHADADTPHHCAFVDAPFGAHHLRLDCPEHEPAAASEAARLWSRFAAPPSSSTHRQGEPR
ncbi:MarR family winged helix-turn-helix transcriptional regulator [Arhodomonas sp. AD133]|uniref:MarR family winged helix-turn-helix transcriptional regulator n=1 Tax=Arhodomonas sp. AD133 TaxID=3415009 RepID=UPI003EBBBF51